MSKANTKAKKAAAGPAPTTPEKRALKPHQLLVSSTIQNAVSIKSWGSFAGEPDLAEMLDDIRDQVKELQAGDMSRVEAMLYGQAMSLQTIFTSLSRKAASSEYLTQFQAHLGLALKAQGQCRRTLEALAAIKNPRPVAFVKQANISGGHQQVNYGAQPQQQAESGQGGGGIKSLPGRTPETTCTPTQGIFPTAEIQTAVAHVPAQQ
jgi:hypothetical protein